MFGNNKPFGTASAFGTSTFGAATTPFGQTGTTAFGAKPATGNVFGTSTFGVATPNTGGLFGNTTPATGASLFGQPSTAFGAPASTSTGTFGFGATSTTGGLFGNTTASTASTGGLFGGSTSAFGTPRPTFGGFGTTNAGTGLFGQSTSTGTGLFGASSGFTATAQMGTTIKFNPPTGTDTMMKGGVSTSIGTRHQCITCMKEYENKSLEELRVEDYAANRKGSSATAIGFGNPTPQTGLFGTPAASTSAFSFGNTTQSKPLFGTTGGANTFGSGSLFGQSTQNQNTGLFGKSVGFGAPTTTAPTVFNFGGSTGTSLFGQNNQQKPLFGQSNVGTGLFGNTATTQATGFGTSTGFGGFGSTNQQTTGLFGAKATAFGGTNTTTTNTFSFGNANNMSGGGLFGQKTTAPAFGATPGFGTQQTGFGAFGANQTAGTGLFGQSKPTTSVFGGTGSTFGTGLGSAFGNTSFSSGLGTNTGTGLFGSNVNKGTGFSFGNTGSTGFNFGGTGANTSNFNFNPSSSLVPGSEQNNVAFQQAQQQILAMAVNPFGDSPLFRNAIKDSARETEVLKPTNPSAQKALLNDNHYKVALLPTAKIKPKPWSPNPSGKVFLFDGLEDEEPSLGNAAFLPKKSVKKLVLKNIGNSRSTVTLTSNISGSSSQPTRIDVSISLKNVNETLQNSSSQMSPAAVPLTVDVTDSASRSALDRDTSDISPIVGSNINKSPLPDPVNAEHHVSMDDSIVALHTNKKDLPKRTYNIWNESDEDFGDRDLSEDVSGSNQNQCGLQDTSLHKTGIILTRPGYYTVPFLDDLISHIDENGNCFVENFTVGREGYGKVTFPGVTNVAGLNLDEIVHFRKKEIDIYPDDDKKPPVNEGLNRRAEVTLENVWPIDKTSHSPIKDPERLSKMGYKDKIEKSTSRLGAKFIDYKPETGSWIFQVEHFSKYGLVEDSDEEMEVPIPPQNKLNAVLPQNQAEQVNGHVGLNDVLQKQQLKRKPIASFPSQDEEMEGITSNLHPQTELDLSIDDTLVNEPYSPTRPILGSNIDAERIQGMKASFFHEEMDDEWGSAVIGGKGQEYTFLPVKGTEKKRNQVTFGALEDVAPSDISKRQRYIVHDENQYHMSLITPVRFSEIGIQSSLSSLSISSAKQTEWISSFPVVKSASKLPVQPQNAIPLTLNKIRLKPFKNSVLWEKQHLVADAGYFMGRSFRVGWRHDGTFVHLEPPEKSYNLPLAIPKFLLQGENMTSSNMSRSRSGFILSLKKLSANCDGETIKQNLIDALQLQLENSVSTVEENAPLFLPKPGVELIHAHSKLFAAQLKDAVEPLDCDATYTKQCAYVWDLLVALWGKVSGLDEDKTPSDYAYQMARREALSGWLIRTTERNINKKIATVHQKDHYLCKIFLLLSGRCISEAVKVAQQFQDYRMSLLLSQAEGTVFVRKLISRQLLNWEQNGAYKFIKNDRIRIYALLAGLLIWENVYETVNCCKDLDWKQSLALQLWYHCSPNSSIQDAVKEYDTSFQGNNPRKYSLPPYPPYIDVSDAPEEIEEKISENIFDTCYHLLKLYCDRTHRLDHLLMPETYSSNHLDYRLSWLLHLALSSVGYNIPVDLAVTLHMNFASELESIGMWHWAVFVLLHHPFAEWRIKYVKDVLLRHVSIEQNESADEKENFMKQHLHIPEEWIFEAKAIRAHTEGKYAEQAWFLLKAGFWSKSHSIVIKHLASDAIINEDYDYLMKYLSELALPQRSCTILDWAKGGQVYLDYINMCQLLKSVLSREASTYVLEKFTPEVMSLCNRLSSIPTVSLKDRLSVAEMAKKTATTLRSIAMLQASKTKNKTPLSVLASYFKNLPMPHDYAVSENRLVAHCFLEEVTSESLM